MSRSGVVVLDWPTETAAGSEHHLRLEIRVYLGAPAVTSGPPERWAPADPPEVDVARAWLVRPRRVRILSAHEIQARLEADRAEWARIVDAAVEAGREQTREDITAAAEERAERARGLL